MHCKDNVLLYDVNFASAFFHMFLSGPLVGSSAPVALAMIGVVEVLEDCAHAALPSILLAAKVLPWHASLTPQGLRINLISKSAIDNPTTSFRVDSAECQSQLPIDGQYIACTTFHIKILLVGDSRK